MRPVDAVEYLLAYIEDRDRSTSKDFLAPVVEAGFTPQEARVLLSLQDSNGRVVSKDRVYAAICAHRADADDLPDIKLVDVLVCKVRKKLRSKPYRAQIKTAWGAGYRLLVEDGYKFPWED